MFFSKFPLSEHPYAAAIGQDTQQQQPQASQTYGKSVRHPVQQHLPQQKIQKTDLSVKDPSSSENDKLKVASGVRQIMTELNEAVSENKVMMVLDLIQRNGC
jgi:hypothetical protein